jgi:large subunit ribosomal protein L21
MYAIVEISGKQYKLEKDATVNVDKLESKENDLLTLDKVLLYADGENVMVGQPYLSNVKVEAKVIGNAKGKKVRGIKFKKRKNYTRTLGSRPEFSQLKINSFLVS